MMIYFDNSSTTDVCAESREAAARALEEFWANPSSLYGLGARAERELNAARKTVAQSLGCGEGEIYFTASGTEANNLAVLGAARARKAWGTNIVSTDYEHPSVKNALAALADEGFHVTLIKPKNGEIDLNELLAAVNRETALVAAMGVNNETGALIDVQTLASEVKKRNGRTAVHCDWVQGYLKRPMDVGATAVDTLSVSGHKIHAPKGIGALYVRRGFNLKHTLYGGKQEQGLRPGTENVAFAMALAAAVKAHRDAPQLKQIKEYLISELARVPGAVINYRGGADNILNFSLPGHRSENILHFLEQKEIYVSSGSACSKGERSHTLSAMGLPDAIADSAVRVSLDGNNTMDEAIRFMEAIKEANEKLARVR